MTTFMVNSSGKILRLLPGKNGEKISFTIELEQQVRLTMSSQLCELDKPKMSSR